MEPTTASFMIFLKIFIDDLQKKNIEFMTNLNSQAGVLWYCERWRMVSMKTITFYLSYSDLSLIF